MSDNNKTSGFRTALRGYNKDDVNSYIIKENEIFKAKEAEYIDRIKELEARAVDNTDTERLLSENKALKSEITELKSRLSQAVNSSDFVSEDVGVNVDEILAFAVKEAERILSEAKTAGLKARDEISKNTAVMKSEIQSRSDSIIEDIRQKVKSESDASAASVKRRPGRPPKNKDV